MSAELKVTTPPSSLFEALQLEPFVTSAAARPMSLVSPATCEELNRLKGVDGKNESHDWDHQQDSTH